MSEESKKQSPVLITGGCGFIGTNLAHRLMSQGRRVRVLDSLTRPGVEQNLEWLQEQHPGLLEVERGDVRNLSTVRKATLDAEAVFHLAAQVAVTASLADPLDDFEVNARGTINLLESVRELGRRVPVVYTSTNKVYGALQDIPLRETATRYEPQDATIRGYGVSEARPLDFHSPYGCSKGTADQYVLDYSRSYRMHTAVFRMSCIYGPHQFGNEDQGWVAHFLIRAIDNRSLTLYGNGKQVRDVLFIDDLINAFLLAERHMDRIRGRAFNIGGAPVNTLSLIELLDLIETLTNTRPRWHAEGWRTGDQRYYVSDTRAFREATGWAPQIGVRQGLARLHRWLVGVRETATSILQLPVAEPRALAARSAPIIVETGAAGK